MNNSTAEKLVTFIRLVAWHGEQLIVNVNGNSEEHRNMNVRIDDALRAGCLRTCFVYFTVNEVYPTVECSVATDFVVSIGLPEPEECQLCGEAVIAPAMQVDGDLSVCGPCKGKLLAERKAAADRYGDEQCAILAGAFPDEPDVLAEIAAGRKFDEHVAKMPMVLVDAAHATALARARRGL
jgi:hypothetical protein